MTFKKGYTPWNKGKTLTREHKEKLSIVQRGTKNSFYGRKHTKESRNIMSEAHKNITEETRRKMSESHKGDKHHNYGKRYSMELRKKLSESHKGQIPWMKGKKHSSETKAKISEKLKGNKSSVGRIASAKTREKLRKARLNQKIPYKDTKIEIIIQNGLNEKGYNYEKHLPVCGICRPDIVFPDEKIAIFLDGNYWHSKEFKNGVVWKRDRKIDRLLKENEWVVMRFWESEIDLNFKGVIHAIGELLEDRSEREAKPVDAKVIEI